MGRSDLRKVCGDSSARVLLPYGYPLLLGPTVSPGLRFVTVVDDREGGEDAD